MLEDAIKKAGHTGKVQIGMDVAASEFYENGVYDLDFKNPKKDGTKSLSAKKLTDLYLSFVKNHPIVSIEDPFDQDDWEGYA